MRLAEGSMKRRMTDVGAPPTWWMGVLSNSNPSLDEIAAIDHCHVDDALRTRLIDVPLPPGAHGAFECLHGFDDHAAFAAEVLRIARDHYGVAMALRRRCLSNASLLGESATRRDFASGFRRVGTTCAAKRSNGSCPTSVISPGFTKNLRRYLLRARWRSSSGFCPGPIASLPARC